MQLPVNSRSTDMQANLVFVHFWLSVSFCVQLFFFVTTLANAVQYSVSEFYTCLR